jgi:predicted MFS family arabinose efflux permease
LGLVFSIPTGWIFDKYKLKGEAILVLATLITFLAAISIPDVITSHVLTFILYGIMGLSTDFIFIGSFSVLNGKYQKEELISANSTLQFFGGIANVSSAFITGFCIQKGGSIILPVLVLCFVFLTCLLFKMFYKRRSY